MENEEEEEKGQALRLVNVMDRGGLRGNTMETGGRGKVIEKKGQRQEKKGMEGKCKACVFVCICLYFVCICEGKQKSCPSLWMST